MTSPPITIALETDFKRVSRQAWDNLDRGDFVFADYDFLATLQSSGCLGGRTGWHPQILLANDGTELVGACLLFARTNSYGEYIFDWAWARAADGAHLPYYPKLTSAVPFTPATGVKFLLHANADQAARARVALLQAARELMGTAPFSSLHFLFTTPAEGAWLREQGLALRHSYQFHWQNRGWKTFTDFLASLRRKRRTEIRREREAAARLPVEIQTLTGAQLTAEHAAAMYGFYLDTIEKMGAHPYLTREFFLQIFATCADRILFIYAEDDNGPVAGALNFFRGRTLFGRYWGTTADHRHLHFEMCYYRTLDWALANGIERFEAGAQGEQKFSRGFLPNLCYSAHEFNPALMGPSFEPAIAEFIDEEKKQLAALFADYLEHDPYQTP